MATRISWSLLLFVVGSYTAERERPSKLSSGRREKRAFLAICQWAAVDLFHIYRGVLDSSEIFPFKRYFIEVRQVCLVSIIVLRRRCTSPESLGVLHLSLNKRHFDDLHVGQIPPLGSCRRRSPSRPPTGWKKKSTYFLQLGGTTGWFNILNDYM